ncbi:MAG: SseB family protein [Lachnospiraceae bacterium]|jgi:hypothetical protein|nr:SseB family protein [Lachnospiraceae bacterium]
MSIDNKFIIKKLQKLDDFYAVFSPLTRMPYVACDEETFDDQIYIFSSEASCKEFVKTLNEQQVPAALLKIPQAQGPGFFGSLYSLDVNMVVFHDDTGDSRLAVEELVKQPDMEKIHSAKIPIMNPQLTLTMIYFVQELRRPVKHDMARLRELEEEMVANLVKAHFILGIETVNDEENTDPEKVTMKNIRIPFMKSKDGDIFHPIYSDFSEFRKYAGPKAKDMRMSNLTLKQLPQFLIKDSKGFVVNPAGVNLVLTVEQLKQILKDFP